MKSQHVLGSCALALVIACGGGDTPPPNAPPPTTAQAPTTPTTPAATSTAPTTTSATPSTGGLSDDAARAIVTASDRTPEDRKVDVTRNPMQFLQFIGIAPGMKAADLGAGGGYTTELLARAVGANGKVWSQNDPGLVKKFMDKPWSARLASPADKNVVRVERAFDDPLPADAKDLDLVVIYIFYHDVVWIGADRDKMNKAVFAALKPGGTYVVVDASAKSGDGIGDAKTLHRIDEAAVKSEVQKAGFTLSGSGEFLRNPSDARDWNSSPMAAGDRRGTEDRFALKFTRP